MTKGYRYTGVVALLAIEGQEQRLFKAIKHDGSEVLYDEMIATPSLNPPKGRSFILVCNGTELADCRPNNATLLPK